MRFLDEYEMPVPEYVISNGYTELDKEMAKVVKGWHNTSKSWKTYTYKSLNTNTATSSLCDATTVREDMLGRLYTFDDNPARGYNGPRICVDINGVKNPNILGIDLFTFLFTQDGHIIPEGQDHENNNYTRPYYSGGTFKAASQYCTGRHDSNSLACTYYAMQNKNPKGNGTYWEDFIGRKLYK
jgi:hypothetical protein